jgi:hypothetical protein
MFAATPPTDKSLNTCKTSLCLLVCKTEQYSDFGLEIKPQRKIFTTAMSVLRKSLYVNAPCLVWESLHSVELKLISRAATP